MTTQLAPLVSDLSHAYHAGRSLALFTDYDGTLVPFSDRPEHARLDATARELIIRLASMPRVAFGVLSGRPLHQLQEMVGIAGIYYAGMGGMELDLHGRELRHAREAEAIELMERVATGVLALTDDWPGVWVEQKSVGITVHYRALPEERREPLEEVLEEALTTWRREVVLLQGSNAIDVLPRDGWTKGTAVEMILEDFGDPDAVPFFAGDSEIDVAAFLVVESARGITVGVGADVPSGPSYWLPDAAALHGFFEELLAAIAASS